MIYHIDMSSNLNFNVLNLIRCKYRQEVDGNQEYFIILASPAKGVLYVTQDCPYYISGQIRVRGTMAEFPTPSTFCRSFCKHFVAVRMSVIVTALSCIVTPNLKAN